MNEMQSNSRQARKLAAISHWEGRAGLAFRRLRGAAPERIEAAYDRWLAKGREEIAGAFSIRSLILFASFALGEDAQGHPSADRLLRIKAFSDGLAAHGFRIHHTYLDRLLEAEPANGLYHFEIEAEAHRLAQRDGYESDPADAYHAALLTYLLKSGQDAAPRPLLSKTALRRLQADILRDDVLSYAENNGAIGPVWVRLPEVRQLH